MHRPAEIALILLLGLIGACDEEPTMMRPPTDGSTMDVPIFDPPDASDAGDAGDAGDAASDGDTPTDTGEAPTWDLYVMRVLLEPPAGMSGWDPSGSVDPFVAVTAGSASASTEPREGVAFVDGWAGAAWIEPVLEEVPQAALLAGIEVELLDADDPADERVALCRVAVDGAALSSRLVSLECAPGATDYAGPGTFDVQIGLRPHADDAPTAGSGPSVWELRMRELTIWPTNADGESWDPGGGAPDPVMSIAMLDNGPGVDVPIPVLTRTGEDILTQTYDPPVVIARLPDRISPVFSDRYIEVYWRLFDDADGTLVPMDECGTLPTGGPPPDGATGPGETFCLFVDIDEAVWTVRYDVVRFGDGWL